MRNLDIIKEAMNICKKLEKRTLDISSELWYHRSCYDDISSQLEKNDWEYLNSGLFKSAFRKGNIVLKIGACKEDKKVFNLVRKFNLNKYFVKTYYCTNGYMIQEYLPKKGTRKKEEFLNIQINKIIHPSHLLGDAWFDNVRCDKNGNPKVIDCFIDKRSL
jgi:hypothetical protein